MVGLEGPQDMGRGLTATTCLRIPTRCYRMTITAPNNTAKKDREQGSTAHKEVAIDTERRCPEKWQIRIRARTEASATQGGTLPTYQVRGHSEEEEEAGERSTTKE